MVGQRHGGDVPCSGMPVFCLGSCVPLGTSIRFRARIRGAGLVAVLVLGVVAMSFFWRPLGGAPKGEHLSRLAKSPHWSNGRFQNLVPTRMLDPGSTWKTLKQQFLGKEVRQPTGRVAVAALTRAQVSGLPPDALRATWIGHATTLVEIGGLRVLTDPIWSERCSPFRGVGPRRFHPPPLSLEELGPVDAVVISHDHYDHLDMSTVVALAGEGTRFFVPLGVGAHLSTWGIPGTQIIELDWNQESTLGTLTFTATPARHYSGRAVQRDRTQWASWVIKSPLHRVFFSGDTGYFDGLKDIGATHGPFDLALIKIGAYGSTWLEVHMDPEHAVKAQQAVGAKLMLPVHWGTFNLAFHDWREPPERLLAAAEGVVAVVVPRPGQPVRPEAPPAVVRWWRDGS